MSKKLLLLTPQLPYPPEQGTSLRNYHILRGLASHFDVTLLSFVEENQPFQPLPPQLTSLCDHIAHVPVPQRTTRQRLHQMLRSREPDMAFRLRDDAFNRKLGRLLRSFQYEVVQIEGIELAYVIPEIRLLSPDSLILFDDHNAETALQRRAFRTDLRHPRRWPAALYSLIQARRLANYERMVCQAADRVVAVSEPDAVLLNQLAGVDVTVIPNCIDVTAYQVTSSQRPWDYDLVFTGKMDYRPNVDAMVWFVQAIWPLIRSRRPQTTLAIVGKNPHERLVPLRRLPGITVTGWVEQVQPYLAGARLFIMPFRVGSGTRLKLIEAMAAGVAIVSTKQGAEGFPVQDDNELRLADDPAAFADIVIRLLNQPGERQRLGRSAAAFAQQYDWREVVPRFLPLYEKE